MKEEDDGADIETVDMKTVGFEFDEHLIVTELEAEDVTAFYLKEQGRMD